MPRLLFDEPLAEQLCEALADLFPESLHVRILGKGGAGDTTVWVEEVVRFSEQDEAAVLELG